MKTLATQSDRTVYREREQLRFTMQTWAEYAVRATCEGFHEAAALYSARAKKSYRRFVEFEARHGVTLTNQMLSRKGCQDIFAAASPEKEEATP